MGSRVSARMAPTMAKVVIHQSDRGRWRSLGLVSVSGQNLPTDPVGVFNLTLLNVAVGSTIYVSDQADTTTLHYSTASGSTVVIQLQTYSAGSSLNNLHIKVRKGSAPPYYRPWETLATAIVGSQSIYVSQIPEE